MGIAAHPILYRPNVSIATKSGRAEKALNSRHIVNTFSTAFPPFVNKKIFIVS